MKKYEEFTFTWILRIYGVKTDFLSESQQLSFLHVILSSTPQLVKLSTNWALIMKTNSVFARTNFSPLILTNLRYLRLRCYKRSIGKETLSSSREYEKKDYCFRRTFRINRYCCIISIFAWTCFFFNDRSGFNSR